MLALQAACALLLAACNGDGPTPPTQPTVATVQVTPGDTTLAAFNDTVRLVATARDNRGQAIAGKSFTWTSMDATIATVNATGEVRAVAPGTAIITATADGVSGTATVRVQQVATVVEVTPGEVVLTALMDTARLAATARDRNGHLVGGKSFVWASSDEAVITVDAVGQVTAVSAGTSKITARVDGVDGSATVRVEQIVVAVEVLPAGTTINVGQTVQLSARAFDARSHRIDGIPFVWTSADNGIAAVDGDGLVRGVTAGGPVAITAAAGGKSGSATVTVKPLGGGGQLSIVRGGDIYLVNEDGSGLTNVTSFPPEPSGFTREAVALGTDWAPTGDRIVAVSRIGSFSGNQNFFSVFSLDGSARVSLADVQRAAPWGMPRWSPDGTKIAYWGIGGSDVRGGGDIMVMNADGSNITNLTNSDQFIELSPAWSPDGRKIAFFAGSTELRVWGIFVMNADGSGRVQLTDNATDTEADWSPDGTRIVFRRDGPQTGTSFNTDIWIMNADGSNQVPLVTHSRRDAQPAWSPDGWTIAFTSLRDEISPAQDGTVWNVFMINVDGSGERQVTSGPAGGRDPRWRPKR